ncbi:hypothetical protein REISMN_04640 [Rickettsia tamurae subsp. buchneri]|uniref:Uncharacterized protein n=1 Tax=Rickettsia tamurae subsp. buchneri TaxID=1462938 RepID=A0A8E1BZT5_9RICK|nr:hypothetical protein REISMN_04640 [Rickettsia tamurae subsp. buchneri]
MIEITMSDFELYEHRAINSYNTVVNIYQCKIII